MVGGIHGDHVCAGFGDLPRVRHRRRDVWLKALDPLLVKADDWQRYSRADGANVGGRVGANGHRAALLCGRSHARHNLSAIERLVL